MINEREFCSAPRRIAAAGIDISLKSYKTKLKASDGQRRYDSEVL